MLVFEEMNDFKGQVVALQHELNNKVENDESM
jgi:hypothetical protein